MSKRHTQPLADPSLKAWVAAGKPIAKSDGDGLTFTVSKTGYATWILRYGRAGRRRELTIGRYPEISLAKARTLATLRRAEIDQGVDVSVEKRLAKHREAIAKTVNELVVDYRKVQLDALSASTYKLYGSYLDNWIVPQLGALKLHRVSRPDVVAMMKKAAERGANLRTLHQVTRNVFMHGIGQAALESNPALGIVRRSIKVMPEPRKGIALNDAQTAIFLAALTDDIAGWTFRLHLITGVRPNELLGASWTEFNLQQGVWNVPHDRTKMHRGYKIDLPPQAVHLLEKIAAKRKKRKSSPFLFPASYGSTDRPIPYQTYRGQLRRILDSLDANFPKIKAHDLRRTMRSGLTRLGVRFEVAERAINHKLPSLAEIYDRNDFADERRDAIIKWANHLDGLEAQARASSNP